MRRGLCAAAVLAVLSLTGPAPARACVPLTVTIIGSSPEKEARMRARMERDHKKWLLAERRAYLSDVRAGRIDAAAELARLLIPNVREWWADTSDCGPGGDGDGPHMPPGEVVELALKDTEFEGLVIGDLNYNGRRYERAFNQDCNTELRAAFAVQLARSVERRTLKRVCAQLCQANHSSAARFEDAARRGRPVWENGNADIPKRFPELDRQVQAFWDARLPDLTHLAQLCPSAWATAAPVRAMLLEDIRRDPIRAKRLVKLANKRRAR